LFGFILIKQHLTLSFFKNYSANSLARGCTGPAPISNTVTLCFLMSGLCKKSSKPLDYSLNFFSFQSKSPLMLILGLIILPHSEQLGIFSAKPLILSSSNSLGLTVTNLPHFLHNQSKRHPLALTKFLNPFCV
jgi:hypothetical protein